MGTNAIVGGGVPQAAGFAWATGTPAPTPSRSPTSATAPSTSARPWRRSTSPPPGSCRSASSSRTTSTPSRPPSHEATGEPRLSARGLGLRHRRAGRSTAWTRSPSTSRCSEARRAHARRSRPDGGRGRHLPLLPPERRLPRQRVRLPRPRRRRRRGGSGTRSTRSPATSMRRGLLTPDDVDARGRRSAKRLMEEIGDVLLEPVPGRQARPAPDQARPSGPTPAFVDVGVRGDLSRARRRPARDRRRASPASCSEHEVHRRRRRRDGPPDGDRRRRRRHGRGRPPPQRRHQRRHPRPQGRASPTASSARPISENAFAGLGGGIALDGRFRPVVEFMYADFMWVAADQLFNQIAKARHMFGGDGAVPFVLRSKVAMGTGYGSQHSMDPAGIFATVAGLADRRAVHAVRLRRPDEHRPALPGPGRRARARRPLQLHRARARSTTSTTACPSARRRSGARARTSRSSPTSAMVADVLEARRGARRGRRRGDRPALARPGQHRLGDHRGEHQARPTTC